MIGTWKAEKFDPAHLMSLYKKAGAKYFVSMGVHRDNFDMWNSRLVPWNAANKGPGKDIVGLWRQGMSRGKPTPASASGTTTKKRPTRHRRS